MPGPGGEQGTPNGVVFSGSINFAITQIDSRLEDRQSLYQDVLREEPPEAVLRPTSKLPPLPARLARRGESEWGLRVEFLARMMFSALVDAELSAGAWRPRTGTHRAAVSRAS